MFRTTAIQETETSSRFTMPRIALRERTNDHPMVMFAVIVTVAFASMLFASSDGAAYAAKGAPMKVTDSIRTTEKTSRLSASTETDTVCAGQAWGAESLDCLLFIAKEGGNDRAIRMIASAEPNATTPNVF